MSSVPKGATWRSDAQKIAQVVDACVQWAVGLAPDGWERDFMDWT